MMGSVRFDQDHLNAKLMQYCELMGYDATKIINKDGNCNGWSFLFAYYESIGAEKEFFKIKEYISKWPATSASLKADAKPDKKSKK